MINIILKDNEDGYDKVGKVVDEFVEKYGIGSMIVKLALAYTPGERPDISNELLLYEDDDFIWENDWWEGQKYIRVIAIDFVQNAVIFCNKLIEIEKE